MIHSIKPKKYLFRIEQLFDFNNTKLALQTKYSSPLAGYYGYGMSNYGLPQVNTDSKFYFNFGQNDSLHNAMGYSCMYFLRFHFRYELKLLG